MNCPNCERLMRLIERRTVTKRCLACGNALQGKPTGETYWRCDNCKARVFDKPGLTMKELLQAKAR